ncbi:MAG TPA: DNA mismatch repair endonuclease MutL [Roseiflexaceae bacterium]|nr:DNA mismatch repair endonuclease MutL [Roseiflexaceae bacterium]HMP42582.1 DNA mismatch repair endonuclease MutL [Roseiflexaceae bacterium]
MTIRVLEPTVAAQIAAGEVVERPASVVRELVENALDAGARQIRIEVFDGGLRELSVHDDGCGMAAAEVELAFARHATSKLRSADDLWAIATLGFRGEALPSVAAVAQVVCVTRARDEAVGTELRIAGGELQARRPRGAPPGTTISVRNLFYNTPVRREFLRSEASETTAIAGVVTQYALAYPQVRFSLLIDERLALQTNGSGDLRTALIEVYGIAIASQMLPLAAEFGSGAEAIRLSGMIAPPGLTRSSRNGLHLFVNRRAIQPRGQIALVIEEAYHTLLLRGRHPLVVLQIAIDPAAVDVNVHPTKSEVKFRDAARVMSAIGRAVRDTLIDAAEMPAWEETGDRLFDIAQRRFELRRLGGAPQEPQVMTAWEPAALPDATLMLQDLQLLGQIAQTYLVADGAAGMVLIDQHAAHARICYERLAAHYAAGQIERQPLVPPLVVELPPEVHATLLGAAGQLEAWGFVIGDFGAALRIREAPAGMAAERIASVLQAIGERLMQGGVADEWPTELLMILACHSAVQVGDPLTPADQAALLQQLQQCAAPLTSPRGRPTLIVLTHVQLARQFGYG